MPLKPKKVALTLLNEAITVLDTEPSTGANAALICQLLEAREVLTRQPWVGKVEPFEPDAAYVEWLEQRAFEQQQRGIR